MLSQQEPLRSQLPSWSYLLLDLDCIPNLKPFILSLFSSLYRLHFQDLMVDLLNFSFTSSLTPWTFQLIILFLLVLDQFSYWPLLLLQPVRAAGKMKDSNGINHSYWRCSLYMSSPCCLILTVHAHADHVFHSSASNQKYQNWKWLNLLIGREV